MPVISFNNQALSSFGTTPVNLNWSLSSTGEFKTVELVSTGTANNSQVRAIAFNALTAPASGTGSFTTLSAAIGTTLRVDQAYNGQTMALIFTDNSSSLFTVATGAATQSLTANGFNTSYPQIQKEVYLGYR